MSAVSASQLACLKSSMFSCSTQFFNIVSKGVSANMLKISSKRRRTLTQIKAEKEAAAQKEADIEAKLAMVE